MTKRYVQIFTSLHVLVSLVHGAADPTYEDIIRKNEKSCCSIDNCNSCMSQARCNTSPAYCSGCSIGKKTGSWCKDGLSTQDETTWMKTGQWVRQQSSNYSLGAMFVSLLCALVATYLAYCYFYPPSPRPDPNKRKINLITEIVDKPTKEKTINEILEIYHELSQCMTIREDQSMSRVDLQRQDIFVLKNKLRTLTNQKRGQYSLLVGLQLCLFLVQFLNF